jgi:hypothetical protein
VDFLRILRIRLARIGYCRASVPTSVPKPTRRVPQISIADDIIAIEDAARLVTAQFIATRSGMPPRTMFRMAVRRKSCGMLPGQPAAIRARHQAW